MPTEDWVAPANEMGLPRVSCTYPFLASSRPIVSTSGYLLPRSLSQPRSTHPWSSLCVAVAHYSVDRLPSSAGRLAGDQRGPDRRGSARAGSQGISAGRIAGDQRGPDRRGSARAGSQGISARSRADTPQREVARPLPDGGRVGSAGVTAAER